jgi:hypothetical protein
MAKATQYTTLSETDKYTLLLDTLRGRESDHYRLSHLAKHEENYEPRVDALAAEIADLRKDVEAQEKKAKAEQEKALKEAEKAAS